ncbi:ANTAR domain-containing protein [Allonocardiopsis opalescens]|uniref:ANTAR domain-containing protein n=1 Tax=Allonocardiopsis opalescens TaxID=1144618 RepID=A0A2T0Q0Q3_9ACTN|nr:ANTAR domain-containing protein [Allonocardiopsis opalescens]PRX97295.1 ANTAR domain-containing protein [Allonocardiopsis opalescens]
MWANGGEGRTGRAGLEDTAHAVESLSAEVARLRAELDHATAALASQGVIERAKGMVMLACGCDAEAAWQTIVRSSQATNTKARDIAGHIIDVITRASPGTVPSRTRHAVLRELWTTRRDAAPAPRREPAAAGSASGGGPRTAPPARTER